MARSERTKSSRNSILGRQQGTGRGGRAAPPGQSQSPAPDEAEFVGCDQTIYTVRHGGQPAGRLRHGPPTRRCQAIAPTTRRTGVARPLRGGAAPPTPPAPPSPAHALTPAFRPGSCRARCAAVHILPSAPNSRRSRAPFGDAAVRWEPQADPHSNRLSDLSDPALMVTHALNLVDPGNWQEVTVKLAVGAAA